MPDHTQNDLYETELAQKLKQLAERVPGLKDFLDREKLREQDKMLREHTAGKLQELKDSINGIKQKLLDDMKLSLLTDLDRLTSQIDRLRDKHRFDAYGYAGAFDEKKILAAELIRLFDYDLKILDKVETMIHTCQDFPSSQTGDEPVDAAIDAMKVELAALAKLIDHRQELFADFGD